MRGSSAPSFDTRAKYGMPLQGSRAPPPPRGERRAPKAPMFSPAIEPQSSFELHPPPLSNDEALLHASADSVSNLRAHRDVYPGPLEDGRWKVAGCDDACGAGEERTSRHGGAVARAERPSDMPQDVVTAMALALGAPPRPARASPTQGHERKVDTMSEVRAAAPASWAARQGDSVQGLGRVCDLLFFGDELPVPLALLEVLPATGSGALRPVRPCAAGVFSACAAL